MAVGVRFKNDTFFYTTRKKSYFATETISRNRSCECQSNRYTTNIKLHNKKPKSVLTYHIYHLIYNPDVIFPTILYRQYCINIINNRKYAAMYNFNLGIYSSNTFDLYLIEFIGKVRCLQTVPIFLVSFLVNVTNKVDSIPNFVLSMFDDIHGNLLIDGKLNIPRSIFGLSAIYCRANPTNISTTPMRRYLKIKHSNGINRRKVCSNKYTLKVYMKNSSKSSVHSLLTDWWWKDTPSLVFSVWFLLLSISLIGCENWADSIGLSNVSIRNRGSVDTSITEGVFNDSGYVIKESGICESIDIKNSPDSFKALNDCRVVEGFVMITLMDRYNETHYDKWEFPLLTEITDFLLVYRVNGLKTLSKLFPNLRVIRGNRLIKDYALVIFEMMNLQEIGLKSLTYISRGGVRIEKNPMLCFVETIDWTLIATNAEAKDNFIDKNKPVNECPVCPSGRKEELNAIEHSDIAECAVNQTERKIIGCWNLQTCQKGCPTECGYRACAEDGNIRHCCNESCIGGCFGNNYETCILCRHFSIGDYNNRTCVEQCPDKTYKHENRRCITAEECRNITRPLPVDGNALQVPLKPYIPFAGECTIECPPEYYIAEVNNVRLCKLCDGKCKKECSPGIIDSISAAQTYRGCSKITGTLIIQIRSQGGLNVVKELETALSEVEEIEGALKITRSFPIVSLSFFKKLKIIRGQQLESVYVLYVMENQNLQSLFNQTVIMERGKVFFHFNPKLCYSTILSIKDNVKELAKSNLTEFEPNDVAKNSNGDKIACNVTLLGLYMNKIGSRAAVLKVQAMNYDDPRVLLGYVVYYIIAPHRNVSLYDGRDACGGDGWKVEDVTNYSKKEKNITILLSHLKPYTQYACYVRTYTIASEQFGGQTAILYFRTDPSKPSIVQKASATADSSSEITVRWEPPKESNGNLSSYVIICSISYDDEQLLEQRDYCDKPLKHDTDIRLPKTPEDPTLPATTDDTCDCSQDDKPSTTRITDAEAESVIDFENTLQNIIYVRNSGREERSRRRRGAYINETKATVDEGDEFPTNFGTNIKQPPEEKFVSKEENGIYTRHVVHVNSSVSSVKLVKLRHYSSYTISVKACREHEPEESQDSEKCSKDVIMHQRTLKIDNADTVRNFAVEKLSNTNHSLGAVKLSWLPPENPNGPIVSYIIRNQRDDIDNITPLDTCISKLQYQNASGSHTISNLDYGNYSFSVKAISLAGDADFTPPKQIKIDKPSLTTATKLTIGFGVVLAILAIVFVALWYYRLTRRSSIPEMKLLATVNPEYVYMQYQPDEWEVPRENIIQLRELGQGSFGMVYEGIIKSLQNQPETRCAIKTVNENATDRERINFLKEAAVMKAFDTHHVVRLLGVVSIGQPTLVIMELMVNGDLKEFLRSHRPNENESVKPFFELLLGTSLARLYQMAIEIADGMAYLCAHKFVHRDLAARNCMVSENFTVKIGDFGMTRDIYETDYYRKGTKGLLPVRWMAPESLKDGIFSSASDVFSYGVVLWEMATLAAQPYQGLTNDQVLRYVIDGGVMERPENCPDKLYKLMCRTWQHRPSARPSFTEIISELMDEASPEFKNVSYYHSATGAESRQANLKLSEHDADDVTTPLRAEEDDFSLDVGSYLMPETENMLTSTQNDEAGPSHSPLR